MPRHRRTAEQLARAARSYVAREHARLGLKRICRHCEADVIDELYHWTCPRCGAFPKTLNAGDTRAVPLAYVPRDSRAVVEPFEPPRAPERPKREPEQLELDLGPPPPGEQQATKRRRSP